MIAMLINQYVFLLFLAFNLLLLGGGDRKTVQLGKGKDVRRSRFKRVYFSSNKNLAKNIRIIV